MYMGIVAKTKETLRQVAIDKTVKINADGIMALLVDSYDVIQILENDCRTQYSEGRADGMERMAEIICGKEQ